MWALYPRSQVCHRNDLRQNELFNSLIRVRVSGLSAWGWGLAVHLWVLRVRFRGCGVAFRLQIIRRRVLKIMFKISSFESGLLLAGRRTRRWLQPRSARFLMRGLYLASSFLFSFQSGGCLVQLTLLVLFLVIRLLLLLLLLPFSVVAEIPASWLA